MRVHTVFSDNNLKKCSCIVRIEKKCKQRFSVAYGNNRKNSESILADTDGLFRAGQVVCGANRITTTHWRTHGRQPGVGRKV